VVKVLKVWKNHQYARGANKGLLAEALPLWSSERKRYDLYPPTSNIFAHPTGAETLEDLWDKLGTELSVRCAVPANGDTPILKGPFRAIVER